MSLAPATTVELRGETQPPGFRGDHFLVPVRPQTGTVIEVVVRSAGVPETGDRVGIDVDRGAVLVVDRESPHVGLRRAPEKPKE